MTNVIEATGVRRTYGKGATAFEAVRGIDLSLRKGELLAILGVNGAGKTSLLEVLEGMAPATAGSIEVFGKDPHRQRAQVRPRTGIMLQDAGFAGDLTVGETLTMWHGTLGNARPVEEAMDLVELSHRSGVRVKSLSGGERRRLDLAMATLGRPELLFLDEPTTGLDPASRERTWELVRAMLEGGTTVLLTTHYLEEAERLADRVVIMAEGVVAREGTVASIVAEEPAAITFAPTAMERLAASELAGLPGLAESPRVGRTEVELASSDLQETLTALLLLARDRGARLEALDARSASLERAFLSVSNAAGIADDAA
ncbi:MAG TPA: ABC transporter ATP-binding protein [Actinomycetales bacterium]|nr:ABC transporter ATP-binding protein [Actinomycetales bacterium]